MPTISRTETIAVAYETDVCVVGGGPAGIGAALAAARRGQRVIIVEQANCLGGVATSGLHGHLCLFSSWGNRDERVVGGIGHEIAERIVREGFGRYDGANCDFEVEGMKLILEQMMLDTKRIRILYYSQFSDVVVDNGCVTHVIIQSKSGRQAIKAAIVIDCTGDADVAARAGVPFSIGRAKDNLCQPMTLMFQIGGVDFDRVNNFRHHQYQQQYDAGDCYKLSKVWAQAQANGDMQPFQTGIMGWWHTPTRPDQLGINFTHISGRSTINVDDLTAATIEGRRQAYASIDVYRKYIPGMQDCWMSHSAAIIGTRESRRIDGDYQITEHDLMQQREFDDSIGYGSFFIDIHCCDGPGMDDETWQPPVGFKYQIPYRALLPKTIANMLVAGRCISCTHMALGSLRVMPQCILEGEACGVAADLALSSGLSPRQIDSRKLQSQLREQGAIVTAGDIVSTKR